MSLYQQSSHAYSQQNLVDDAMVSITTVLHPTTEQRFAVSLLSPPLFSARTFPHFPHFVYPFILRFEVSSCQELCTKMIDRYFLHRSCIEKLTAYILPHNLITARRISPFSGQKCNIKFPTVKCVCVYIIFILLFVSVIHAGCCSFWWEGGDDYDDRSLSWRSRACTFSTFFDGSS